jgi:YVTN family beta-propeller protein/autotransporter-associated beta strand protein
MHGHKAFLVFPRNFSWSGSGTMADDRMGLHRPNQLGWRIAAGLLACCWAAPPSDAQIRVDAYISSANSNTISVLNTNTNTVTGPPIPVGTQPIGVATTPDGRLVYVANLDSVSVINTTTRSVSNLTLGGEPVGIAMTPNAKFAYVSGFSGNNVSVINTATNMVVGAPIPVGTNPFDLAVTPNGGFAYVANSGSNSVSVIDTATHAVVGSPIPVGVNPHGLAISPDGQFVYVTNFNSGTISKISTATNTVVATIPLPFASGAGIDVVTPNGKFVYVTDNNNNEVSMLSTATDEIVGGAVPVGNHPLGVAITPNGDFAYVMNTSDNTVSVIGTLTNTVIGAPIAVGAFPGSLSSFIGPNIIVAQGGPLLVPNDAALTPLGFGTFVDFDGGTVQTTGNLVTSRTISLLPLGGTINTNGFDSSFSGPIINSGSLTKTGKGTLTLLGNNSYTGGTNILGGVLNVVNDTNLGSGNITIGNQAELLTSGPNFSSGKTIILSNGGGTLASVNGATAIYGGTIGGSGPLVIGDGLNQGTIILKGVNTYAGGTILDAGTLAVNSTQALGLGNLVVNGGVLRADPQPINVKGNYTQSAGGTLQLSLGGSAPGQYDLLDVSGAVALNGTLQLLTRNGFQPAIGEKLTIVLGAAGVSGQFSQVLEPFGPLSRLEVVYLSNSVLLEFGSNFTAFAQTPNQRAVAAEIDSTAFDRRQAALLSFLQSEPVRELDADFDKISPESLSAVYEISFSNANVQAINLENRFAEIRYGSSGFTSSLNLSNTPGTIAEGKDGKATVETNKNVLIPGADNRWGVWISGSGEFVDINGDGNGKGYDFTTGGVSLGLDYRLTKNIAVGFSLGYARTWTNLTGNGNIDVNSGRAGIYATYFQGGFYLSGYAGGAYSSYDARRDALGGEASGSTSSGEFDSYAGAGYDFHCGRLTFGPIASLAYTYVGLSAYTESGSLAPLQIVSQSQDSLRTNLGMSGSYACQVGRVQLRPSLRASWQHEFLYSALPIDSQFASGAGGIFTVQGPALGHDSALIDAGIDLQWTPTVGTYFGYDGLLGRGNYDSNGVVCSVQLDF